VQLEAASACVMEPLPLGLGDGVQRRLRLPHNRLHLHRLRQQLRRRGTSVEIRLASPVALGLRGGLEQLFASQTAQ